MPTWQGSLLLFLLVSGLFYSAIIRIYPFLAQHHPVANAEVIIIEGWLADAEMDKVVKSILPGQILVTTGGPVTFGGILFKGKTYAEVAAERLSLLGMDPEKIICAPAPDVRSDRTYASALAARDVLKQRGLFGKTSNIYSLGAHSRRSLYLYKRAFGSDYPVGIVSLESQEADLRHWWRSSLAFKQVFGELIAWVYTLCSSCKYA